MIKTAKELKTIAEKAQLENDKNLFKHAEIDIEERLMPHLIQKAEKGEREMNFTVDKSLENFVCIKLRDMGFRVQWSVMDTNYKITW